MQVRTIQQLWQFAIIILTHLKVTSVFLNHTLSIYRIRIRGIKNLIFYDLPNYPHFYSEMCNMMKDPKEESQSTNLTCTVIYNRFDGQKLAEIVGHQRAGHMVKSDKTVHMFVTGET